MIKSYPHQKSPKNRKKRVIHEVIHVIHRKKGGKSGLHSKKSECMFCEEIIKLIFFGKKQKKSLHFQM